MDKKAMLSSWMLPMSTARSNGKKGLVVEKVEQSKKHLTSHQDAIMVTPDGRQTIRFVRQPGSGNVLQLVAREQRPKRS